MSRPHGSRNSFSGKRMLEVLDENAKLKSDLICWKKESANWHNEVRILATDLVKCRSDLAIAKKGLQQILDYGEALQPTPMHPITFNACAIAQEALSKIDGGKA